MQGVADRPAVVNAPAGNQRLTPLAPAGAPTVRQRLAWTLTAIVLAGYWAAVVAYAPLVSGGLALWDPTGAAVGLLVAYTAGQLATCGYRPGRQGSAAGIV